MTNSKPDHTLAPALVAQIQSDLNDIISALNTIQNNIAHGNAAFRSSLQICQNDNALLHRRITELETEIDELKSRIPSLTH